MTLPCDPTQDFYCYEARLLFFFQNIHFLWWSLPITYLLHPLPDCLTLFLFISDFPGFQDPIQVLPPWDEGGGVLPLAFVGTTSS